MGFKPLRGRKEPWANYRTARLVSVGAAAGAIFAGTILSYAPSIPIVSDTTAACNIKGNISMNTGERIYHMPGQAFYDATVISSGKGERWFCSETEARAAGWRKSKV
jgi:hypothetical protein